MWFVGNPAFLVSFSTSLERQGLRKTIADDSIIFEIAAQRAGLRVLMHVFER